MFHYVRPKKVKDIESPVETILFPSNPTSYSRGNITSTPESISTVNTESVSDIRLN